jgi:hypothetical protein
MKSFMRAAVNPELDKSGLPGVISTLPDADIAAFRQVRELLEPLTRFSASF